MAESQATGAAGRSHVSHVRVRYAETDQMGVAYYANYLVWFEVARTDWLRAAGLSYRELEAGGLSLPVIEAHCEYKAPAHYDDELVVKTTGKLLSPARVEFAYEITRPSDATINALGRTVHAAVDANGRPCRLPDYVRELLE